MLEYYYRAIDLLLNCSRQDDENGQDLSLLYITFLSIAIKAYLRRIYNLALIIKSLEYYIVTTTRSLYRAYKHSVLQQKRLEIERKLVDVIIKNKRLELIDELILVLTVKDSRLDTFRILADKIDALN